MNSNFLFRVIDVNGQILIPDEHIDKYEHNLSSHFFETDLFPADLFHESIKLQLHFPDQNFFIFKRMIWLIIITIMVVAAVVFAILMLTRTLLHQQNYNTMKSDFISNMTHEFKTPISTISLACEALTDTDMTNDAQPDNPFIQMIQQENKRLESLVESILQSAVIEKGELKIKNEKIDFHELIVGVVKNVQLRIQSTSGDLYTGFGAKNYLVDGDQMHLTNVLNNLIDNAIKYCEKAPTININTYNEVGNWLVCEVQDNGIGIKKEYLPRIFDKLYRVPTGNVHNVKGFGLGLSYVKNVLDLHHGKIEVESKINEGSTFKIKLKLYE
jgi:two-component system phosphate regulon sensor histidine kinase PhoR